MRKEIEVKARIGDADAVAQKLIGLGCKFAEPVEQLDTIFVDDNYGVFDESQLGKNVLRIRESGGKFLFTIKQPQSNEMDAIEHETIIADPVEFRKALELMGYHEAVQVKKVRQKTSYNNWEVNLDEIEGLGSFIEVESITDESDAEKVQNELFSFLQTLGVKPEDRTNHGYDTLIYKKLKSR